MVWFVKTSPTPNTLLFCWDYVYSYKVSCLDISHSFWNGLLNLFHLHAFVNVDSVIQCFFTVLATNSIPFNLICISLLTVKIFRCLYTVFHMIRIVLDLISNLFTSESIHWIYLYIKFKPHSLHLNLLVKMVLRVWS